MVANRTIAVTEETRKRLETIKIHPRETMDDVLNRLMNEHLKSKHV